VLGVALEAPPNLIASRLPLRFLLGLVLLTFKVAREDIARLDETKRTTKKSSNFFRFFRELFGGKRENNSDNIEKGNVE